MNKYDYLKPRYRSKLRSFLGKKYYVSRRYIEWMIHHKSFASDKAVKQMDHSIFTHKTPIYRQLKDVDMWMQYNKADNLKIAIKHIDGLVIQPGQVFSYWKLIGKPTEKKGYKEGMVLHYGDFKSGVGGGLCQLSNLLYWMTLHTPLTVTERHRHGFDVFPDSKRTQPFGSGATCVYNYRDLQIKNASNEAYQINLRMDEKYLIGDIRSNSPKYLQYEVFEKSAEISHEYWGAYLRHNEIWRRVYDLKGHKLLDEYICENHALMMYEPLLTCVQEDIR